MKPIIKATHGRKLAYGLEMSPQWREYGSRQVWKLDKELRGYIFNLKHEAEGKQEVEQDNKYSMSAPMKYVFQQGSPC